MQRSRRRLIQSLGVLAGAGLAGCNSTDTSGTETSQTGTSVSPTGTASTGGAESPVGAKTAVAAQWNVYRARVYDALALGRADATATGASLAKATFQTFEGAGGKWGAHERLEKTNERAYGGFEGALSDLRTALESGDLGAAEEAADTASRNLRVAQADAVGQSTTHALDVLHLGSRAANAALLAAAGKLGAAETVANATYEAFENASAHDPLERADHEAYEGFESAIEAAANHASNGDATAAVKQARTALDHAVTGAYALTAERAAGAGHLATMQARAYDAAALARLGGPGADYAHAGALNVYRARVRDAGLLAARGESDAAATAVENVFAHFEGAKAHEALEHADHEAYEGFEGGLDSLVTAIENGDSGAIDDAIATVDDNLVTGIEALAGEHAAVVQSGFFRARFADARERYELGDADGAAAVVADLFERFESNELGFHETLEHTSKDLYHRFEETHLAGLKTAYENDDPEAVATHHEGVQTALLDFEASVSAALATGAETAYMTGRAFDAAALATLGHTDRAAAVVKDAFETFEAGAAGFHEALEHADHETYEAFESKLGAVRSAAADGGDVRNAAKAFNAEALAALYAVVSNAGGAKSEAAAAIVGDIFASFENARVHELLEQADREAYEGFEAALDDYAEALKSGDASVTPLAEATRTAQFAVVGAIAKAPPENAGKKGKSKQPDLQGGPNVVEGVPDDADHVVKAKAVSFEPAELTVEAGDKVAFEHVAGEAHSVTAYEGKIPDGAQYWASGGFGSQKAAETGWEKGKGAVQSGQSYVHTFETTGEHHYFCIPHEMAGMKGKIVVEE